MTLSHSWMSRPVVSKTVLKSSLVQFTGTLPMNILVGFLSKIVKAKLFVLKEVSSRTHAMESSTLSRFPLYASPPSFLTAS